MTTTIGKKKTDEASLATQLVAGAQKHLANMGQLVIAGGTFTLAQASAQLQAFAKLRSDVEATRAALRVKLDAETAQGPGARAFFLAFIAFVRAAFGASADVLADFGLQPKKAPAPRTAEQKAAAAAKAKATRAARGTIGKRKRALVKGNVTGIEVIPITTGQGAPAQPASNAATGGNTAKS
jgi:hypothetical protein